MSNFFFKDDVVFWQTVSDLSHNARGVKVSELCL